MNDAATTMALAVRRLGSGSPLVLFHGGMGSWNHWIRNLDALATRHTVYAVDLPGYGASYPVPKTISRDAYIDRVIAGVADIVDTSRFALAAFSYGGVVAALTAARLGAQVTRLALVGVGGFGPTSKLAMRPIPPAADGETARREVFRFNLLKLMLADPASVSDETLDLHAYNFDHCRYDGRHFSLSDWVATSLPRIPGPVQFIYGAEDALARTDLDRRGALARSQHPNVRFDVLPGVGHWAQYEAAAEVNRLLLDFLDD